ncbi:MAG: YfdX family protein [Deltaproteobacteria bacterium]|nr:YfdX family protein [Deltaproteobacteria bacterium]
MKIDKLATALTLIASINLSAATLSASPQDGQRARQQDQPAAEQPQRGFDAGRQESVEQRDEPRARARSESLQEEGARSGISMDTQTSIERTASAKDMRAISYAAGRLLVHVDRARTALNQENSDDALRNINQGKTLAKIVENNASVYRVTTSISSGDLKYSTDERVRSLLIPIYTELERVSIIAPIAAAKQSEQARKDSAKLQREPAAKVTDVNLAATSIQLDVATANQQLKQAESAIRQGNLEEADQALERIQQSVAMSYVAVDLPLVQARQNLMLAEAYAQDGRTQDVKRLLQSVADSLEQYAKNADSAKEKEVKSLRDEIENTGQELQGEQQLATQQINDWWQQIANLST